MQADQIEYTPLKGGLDLQTSSLTIKPGSALDLHNYEAAHGGGYRRIFEYERYNGTYGGSRWSYCTITVDTTAGLTIGDVVIGSVSAAGGYLAYIDGLTLVIAFSPADPSPAFVNADTIASGTINLTSDAAVRNTSSTNDATYLNATADPAYDELHQ